MSATPWQVVVIESERGWGQKVVEIRRFATEQEALNFQTEFNKGNTSTVVPDWYMVANQPEYRPE